MMKNKQPLWEYDLGKDVSEILIKPLVKNKQVLFHSNNSLFSLDVESGKENWTTEIKSISGTKLLLMTDELVILHRVIKTDVVIEHIPSFRDEVLGIDLNGAIIWTVVLPSRMKEKAYVQDGNILWLLGHPGEKKQLLHCIDLKKGIISETLELPYKASQITLFNHQFIFHYVQGMENHPGIYVYDKNDQTTKILNNVASHEVFYSNGFIICTSGRNPNFKLEIIDTNNWQIVHQKNIFTESIVCNGGLIFFLEKREDLYLCAMDMNFEIKWEIEVSENGEIIVDSDEYISLIARYDYMIISKNNGKIIKEIKALSIPKSANGNIYVKERNKFSAYTI